MPAPVRFGSFEVDLSAGELRKEGAKVKLQEQPFQVLAALLEQPGDLVSREQLQKRLWPSDVTVDFERGLNKAINRLREALGDDADNPRFIETVPLRGYRFLGQVMQASPSPSPSPPVSRRSWLGVAGAVTAVPLIAYAYRRYLSPPVRIQSIAVLPLENLSRNADQEYFSDGMTDVLIGEIGRIGALRVISRTSVMQYKGGARKSLPAIARELNVEAIVEGTIVHAGSKVRITAQLIRASDDRHLWYQEYEREMTDILTLQGEVARAIAAQVQIKLTPGEQQHLTTTASVSPEAYRLYLQGNFFVRQGARSTAKSIECFQQAIALDPSCADFHAGLAESLCYAAIHGLRPCAEAYPAARAAARRALDLDETNASAHDALADVLQGYDRDLPAARAEFQRALDLNSSNLIVRIRYAENLTRLGRYDEAIEMTRKTMAVDPASPMSYSSRAMILFRSRHFQEAIQAGKQALEFSPGFVQALWWQGVSYAAIGDFPHAIAALTNAVTAANGSLMRGYLGFVYGKAGEREKALGVLREIAFLAGKSWVSPIDYALVYTGLGDADSAFLWLNRAFDAHEMRFELASFYYDGLRSDPRFATLVTRLGLSFPLATPQ